MTNRQAATSVIRTLQQAGYEAYLVGGCVRDELMGLGDASDHDVATSARPDHVRKLFPRARLVGAQFGVVLVGIDQHWIEVASFRTDGSYGDGRHPDSIRFATLDEDAERRDFTVNGLYLDPLTDRLIDRVGGKADLDRRILRAIGDPKRRFAEDYLRMLRAVRFAAKLDFAIDPATADAIRDLAHCITQVSAERLLEELRKTFACRRRVVGLEQAHRLDLLQHILPELDKLHVIENKPLTELSTAFSTPNLSAFHATLAVVDHLPHPCDVTTGLAALLHLAGEANSSQPLINKRIPVRNRPAEADWNPAAALAACVTRRLTCSTDQQRQVVWLLAYLPMLGQTEPLTPAELKRMMLTGRLDALRQMWAARVAAGFEPTETLARLDRQIADVDPDELTCGPWITGEDLQAQGFTPGPGYQTVLDAVYDAQLNRQIATRNEALTLAREWAEREHVPRTSGTDAS